MPDTISINGLSISHKASCGVSTATLPDVCKTPSPGGPVPVPYPNISMSNMLTKGTKTVKVDGGNMAANKGSEYSISIGDEPGVAGGVKSSTFKKESTWITYSFDVKMEGKNVCRLTDKKFHNHQNTVNLAGDVEPPGAVEGMEPPGDCGTGQYKTKTGRVAAAKKSAQKVGSCRVGDDQAAMTEKGKAWQEVADARSDREKTCFRGGDAAHRKEIARAKEHVRRCSYIKRTGKEPAWAFP